MTLRVRVALVVFALTTVTMGAAFGIVWERFVASQRVQLDHALLEVAHREASEAQAGQLEFTDAPGPSANAVGPLPKYGVLYSVSGVPLSTTDNFVSVPTMPRLEPLERGFDFVHDGGPMRGVVVEVGSSGRRILLATTRDDFEEDAKILGRAMMVAFAVGCAWAAVVAFGVAWWLTREHRRVGEVAQRVASGDTSARLSFRSSDDELQRLADDINTMIERLVGLVAVQDRFISHAAHELRTPLTSLRVELEHALRGGREREELEGAVAGALDSARRLTGLTEDLLQLARLREVDVSGETTLDDALSDAIADVAPVGRLRDVFIVANALSARVRGDRRSLARLFRNVLENATRFSPRGEKIAVEAAVDGDRVVVVVSDRGPGVTSGDEERIFEPFARGARRHVEDELDGVGLGLSIARGLARSCGGDVTARAGGDGGHFVIELPLSTEPASA